MSFNRDVNYHDLLGVEAYNGRLSESLASTLQRVAKDNPGLLSYKLLDSVNDPVAKVKLAKLIEDLKKQAEEAYKQGAKDYKANPGQFDEELESEIPGDGKGGDSVAWRKADSIIKGFEDANASIISKIRHLVGNFKSKQLKNIYIPSDDGIEMPCEYDVANLNHIREAIRSSYHPLLKTLNIVNGVDVYSTYRRQGTISRIVVLVDRSGSMSSCVEKTTCILYELFKGFDEGVDMYTFESDLDIKSKYTLNKHNDAYIGKCYINPRGGDTDVSKSIETAIGLYNEPINILVINDGQDRVIFKPYVNKGISVTGFSYEYNSQFESLCVKNNGMYHVI